MYEKLLLNGFIITSIPYAIISIYVLIVLEKEGADYSIFNIGLFNYRSLRRLVKNTNKYKKLYLAYIISTLLPVAMYIVFVVLIFIS